MARHSKVRCANVRERKNFVVISRTVAETRRFSGIENGGHVPFWIFKTLDILTADSAKNVIVSHSAENRGEIGRTAAEISRFNGFQNGGCPASWITGTTSLKF